MYEEEPREAEVISDDEQDPTVSDIDVEAAAVRASSYAIASFGVGLLVFLQGAGLGILPLTLMMRDFDVETLAQIMSQIGAPATAAVIALWLSSRAQDEIEIGGLGGRGFMVAGRVLGALGLILIVFGLVFALVLRGGGGPPFGPF